MATRPVAPPPPKVKIIGTAGGSSSGNTGNLTRSDTVVSSVSFDLSGDSLSASKHNLSLTGSGNLIGYGNSLLWNRLDARSNSGNSTLFAGPSSYAVSPASSGVGPSSSTLYGGSGNDVLVGWTGARTQNSTATASGGSTTLVVASATGFAVGQYLGGTGIAAGTQITGISGKTLTLSKATSAAIAGGTVYTLPVAASTTGTAAKNSTALTLASASQFYVGQIIAGTGIAAGTTVKSISGNTLTLSTATTAAISGGTVTGLDSATPPSGFVPNTDLFIGGTGSSTIFAGNVASTLSGGSLNNYLVADTLSGANQSLWGGNNNGSSLYGNTLFGGTGSDTLRSGTGYNTLISGSAANGGNTLIGGGISNSLVAGAGNDSLAAISGASTLIGGIGKDTLTASSLASSTNWLQSGSTGNGNLLRGGAGANTLVAGSGGHDSILGGTAQNLLLVTSANQGSFTTDTISLSTVSGAQNTLGVSLTSAGSLQDILLSSIAGRNLGTVRDLTSNSDLIVLGSNAESLGVHTVISGSGSDTLSVAAYINNSVLLDASQSVNKASLVGGGTGNDTFNGSRGGYDTMIGASGNDLFVIQASALAGSSFGQINGNGGTDTLRLNAAASLSGTNFNGVSNIEILQLGSGNNLVGSLQGSGIQKIIGNTGSDTLSANVYGSVKAVTRAGSSALTLNVSPGTSSTMGFAVGQVVTGNGIAIGTTITGISTANGTVTLTLSTPTTSLIAQGGAITGWLNNATLDGSAGYGLAPTATSTLQASTNINNAIASITAANYGIPNELAVDVSLISALQFNPISYIHRKGDFLTGLGQNESLVGSNGNSLPTIPFNTFFSPQAGSGNANIGGLPIGIQINQFQVVDNTLISGAFASNTLIGGSGANLYLINNAPGATAALPTIQNPTSLQSGSTIQFTGNGVQLNDTALSSVSARAAQKIITANGNNLIAIGQNAAQIGIQTIIGGVGSDTFTTPSDYVPSVYLDASRNGGSSSLASGSGNDTLLGGSGSSTLLGGDGNNSLVGGNGYNLIKSGVGNSTLDSGYGISTLQADGGTNLFVVRNRYTRIFAPDTLNPETGTTPEVGIVNTYVNFDPIQGSPVSQFSPYYPDNSPSITKSPSFASSDLSSFYNLQYFNLLGSANYGVGNALNNSISAASAGALLLGMGGNNTLIASGAASSLYGDSNANYASPDLYAYAPTDTRDQAFVDGVMGIAGNNSLVATGGSSYLDGGSGYDDGLFDGSGSNTLIASGNSNTLILSHLADYVSLSGASNTVITSVDLTQAPNNVSNLIVNVTPQYANSGEVAFAGQRMTASYAAVAGATGGYTDTNSITAGNAPAIVVNNSDKLQVAYGISDGTVYGSDNVPDANLPLTVGTIVPDPNNPGQVSVQLNWTTPRDPNGNPVGQTMGYLVNYQLVATDANGNILSQTPYLTYLKGTSQDLTGTSVNPLLTVDNLPTSFTDPYTGTTYDSSNATISYNFKVTAQETVLPAYTDANGNLIAAPVSLLGGQGNDVIYGGLLNNPNSTISLTRPVLTNNPIDPLDPGTIPTPAPYAPTATFSGLFPVYESGGLSGNDMLLAPLINDGSGNNFTAYEYINGVPTPVTFSGLNTLEGGQGSDTFYVANGGTSLSTLNGVVTTGTYDNIIKYGNETIDSLTGAVLNNLVVSGVQYLALSDTNVNQGKFINQAEAPYSGQYIGGNRLDNTLSAYGGTDTLLGAGGRDYLDATKALGSTTLIGGTAYGLDSIAGALADYAAGQKNSIYRDTDPVPQGLAGGPGTADPSQYWMVNGGYDPLRNSDTLVASTHGDLLDGGAGNDSMVGGSGNDTLYVSSRLGIENNSTTSGGDVLVGGGGNDWVVYTGSDYYWSGVPGATTSALGFALSNNGDAAGGQSISNIILQAGDPIARYATGNATSTGNSTLGGGSGEVGSNELIGNEYGAILNGGGVGATGIDSLVGHATGLVQYGVTGSADWFGIGGNYTGSWGNASLTTVTPNTLIGGFPSSDTLHTIVTGMTKSATDNDYAVVDAMGSSIDSLASGGATIQLAAGVTYLIGSAPDGFVVGDVKHAGLAANNINGIQGSNALSGNAAQDASKTLFGIYAVKTDGAKNPTPNLVAVIEGIKLDSNSTGADLSFYTSAGLTADGRDLSGHMGGSYANPVQYNNGTQLLTAENFAGVGPLYNLAGSNFATQHVIFS